MSKTNNNNNVVYSSIIVKIRSKNLQKVSTVTYFRGTLQTS